MRHHRQIAFLIAKSSLVSSAVADASVRRVLVSIEDVGSNASAPISRFEIKTWGVNLLAICRVPPSWHMEAEKYEDPEGVVSGRADWHGQPLAKLTNLLLVDVYDYQPTLGATREANIIRHRSPAGLS